MIFGLFFFLPPSPLPSDINTNPMSGDVRLVDSAGSTDVSAGRVEVFYEGAWATLCEIDGKVANSVCWQTVRGLYHRYGNVTQL